MATTTTITKLLFRRGNDADREQTILASGEPGWTLDTKRLWIGDGVTPGGYPALSARDHHLHFIDTMPSAERRWTTTAENNFGGAQFLDINIPGLAITLAGEDVVDDNRRWFHPVNEDIRTKKNFRFTSKNAELTHSGEGILKIGKSTDPGVTQNDTHTINIGDAIFVYPDKTVKIKVPQDQMLVFDAASAVFDNGKYTHFEDKSIDFNVGYDTSAGASPTIDNKFDEGTGPTSEDAGIYFAHRNYLSAGFVKIGGVGDQTGWNTIELSPTVYLPDWESYGLTDTRDIDSLGDPNQINNLDDVQTFMSNPTLRAGALKNPGGPDTGTYTDGWYCDGKTVGTDGTAPKPLIFHSVRPSPGSGGSDFRGKSYTGNPHFVFESGLMVYDAGDPDLGGYNAYKINQSVDTRAIPTFSGIKIETPDGKPGAPMGVYSGGTGVNELFAGGVLYTATKHSDPPVGSLTSTEYPSPSAHPDNKLKSMPLERGDLMVGTTDYGVVRSKLDHNDWIDVLYDTSPRRNMDPDGEPNGDPGRRDGVIYIGNKFAPDYLKDNTETRESWFARWSTIKTDASLLIAHGTPEITGEVLTIRGDYNAEGNVGTSATTDGGTIRTEAYNSETLNEQGVKVLHNALASTAYAAANNSQDVDPFTLTFFRGDGTKDVTVTTLFAGMQSDDRYFGPLVPTDQTTAVNHVPHWTRNNGMVTAGLTINSEGHIIGMRSKDLDVRYPQLFHVGSKDYRSSKNNGLFSPSDHDQNVSTVTTATAGKPEGADSDQLGRAEEYLKNIVKGQKDLTELGWHAGHTYEPTTYYNSTRTNVTGYENEIDKDTQVITELHFNDYGTIHDYNTKNINDIFYDKEQISVITDWIDMRLTDHDTWITELSAAAFLRDATTVTRDTKKIETKWLNGSEIWFRGTDSGLDNKIYASNTQWNFDVNNGLNLQYKIGTSKAIKWVRNPDINLMTLDSTGGNAGEYDTVLQLYTGNAARFKYTNGEVTISQSSNVNSKVNTRLNDDVYTQNLYTEYNAEVGSNLYIGTRLVNRNDLSDGVEDDVVDRDVYIYFTDYTGTEDQDPDLTSNYLMWSDVDEEHVFSGKLRTKNSVQIDTTLNVTGATTLKNTLTVSNATSLQNTLSVSKTSTFNDDVTIKKDLYVGSNNNGNSTIYFYDDNGNDADGAELSLIKGETQNYWEMSGGQWLKLLDASLFVDRNLTIGESSSNQHTDPKLTLRDGTKNGYLMLDSSADQFEIDTSLKILSSLEVVNNIKSNTAECVDQTITGETKFTDTGANYTAKLTHSKTNGWTFTNSNIKINEQLTVGKNSEFQKNLTVKGDLTVMYDDKTGTGGGDDGDPTPAIIKFFDNQSDFTRNLVLDPSDHKFKIHDATGTPQLQEILHYGNYGSILENGPVRFLKKDDKAADSDLLDGHDSDYFAVEGHTHLCTDITDLETRLADLGDKYVEITGSTMTGDLKVNTKIQGVGAATFNSTLGVDGKATFSGDVQCNGTMRCKNDIIAFSTSDASLKDNLTPIADALNKVDKLTGYEFDWNETKQTVRKGHDVGVVAQEVQQVLPEVVETRDDETLAVDYDKLVPLLLQSIKELKQKVEDLESRI